MRKLEGQQALAHLFPVVFPSLCSSLAFPPLPMQQEGMDAAEPSSALLLWRYQLPKVIQAQTVILRRRVARFCGIGAEREGREEVAAVGACSAAPFCCSRLGDWCK